jgi:hypothetical protein
MKDNLDLFAGKIARYEGEKRALEGEAAKVWRDGAERAITKLARERQPFTSELVTALAGLPQGGVRMNRNNAVGALMAAMAKRGVIVKTGRYVPSVRRSSHGAMLAEWRGT